MLHKDLETSQCSLKFANEEEGVFEGYASVFNSNDAVKDTIAPGAFQKSLENGLPAMFINHNHVGIPPGKWTELKEDDHGLFAKGWIDRSHSQGADLYPAMKDGRMSGMSIGFMMGKSDYELKEDGGRIIKNLNLREVSIVTFPCEDKARISAVKNALMENIEDIRDAEFYLRDAVGLPRSEAKRFLSLVKSITLRDAVIAQDESKTREREINRLAHLVTNFGVKHDD